MRIVLILLAVVTAVVALPSDPSANERHDSSENSANLNTTASAHTTIYLIRHGEKDSKGCLSSAGEKRAENLVKIFNDGQKFSTPHTLYAYDYTNGNCERCKETLTPISKHLSKPIEFHYGSKPDKAAAAMMKSLKATQAPVLAAWEHNHIHDLAEHLGAKNVPTWKGNDFDSAYVLTFDSSYKLTSFEHSQQGFHPKLTSPMLSNAVAANESHDSSENPAQKFVVIGDWGGRSEHEVTTSSEFAGAAGMAKVGQELGGLDFIVSVGDHFYEGGIKGDAHSKRFKQTFEDVYKQSELQCPWYVVMGNHDHNGNVTAQIEYSHISKRWNFPSLWYTTTKEFTVNGKKMSTQLVAIDGLVHSGMHDSHTAVEGPNYWDMEPHPLQEHADSQFQWFDKVMRESTADYLWVYSHYPIYSADGANKGMVKSIGDQMVKYNATGYFAGHQHTMHAFTGNNGAQAYVTQGGGSRGLALKTPPSKPVADGIKWEWGVSKKDKDGDKAGGFSSVLVDDKGSTIRFHKEDGTVLHTMAPIPPRHH